MAGRRRSFDTEHILERVMQVFWRNGYAGTSMSALTAATGLNKPSLYAAFGNKDKMFKAAFDLYMRQRMKVVAHTRGAEGLSLRHRIAAYLRQSISDTIVDGIPIGCFFLSSTYEVASSSVPGSVRDDVVCIADRAGSSVVAFFEAERERGNLPAGTSPEAMAALLTVLQAGLVSLAVRGASVDDLEPVIHHGMKSFPASG